MMFPVYAGVFTILCQCFAPWISMLALKRCRFPENYSVFCTGDLIDNLQTAALECDRLEMEPLTQNELSGLITASQCFRIASLFVIAAMIFVIVSVLTKKTKSKMVVRIGFSVNLVYCLVACMFGVLLNLLVNGKMGRPNTFFNLSIHSQVQITSWVYAQAVLSLFIILSAEKLLSLQETVNSNICVKRSMQEDRRGSYRTWIAVFIILLAIPLVIFFGVYFLNGRSYVFIGLCIVCLAMVPFAMVFENRAPQARELLIIAVMAGIAVVGRMAFFMIPQFKPMTAVIIIAGIGLGAEAGFLTGAVSGFVSNFFFGQGPWTPWQMFAFGIIGFLAGLLFHGKEWMKRINTHLKLGLECLYGGIATFFIYGLLMDLSGVLTMVADGITWPALLAKVISGIPFNFIHALSTVVFLLFLSRPMEQKLNRIKKKYGILEI